MTSHQELLVLQQDVRILQDHQRTLGGVIDTILEDEDLLRKENALLTLRVRTLESEKAALLAANEELKQALQAIIKDCAR